MPVPEPVPAVVIVTSGDVVLYAVCQAPKSGNISGAPGLGERDAGRRGGR